MGRELCKIIDGFCSSYFASPFVLNLQLDFYEIPYNRKRHNCKKQL